MAEVLITGNISFITEEFLEAAFPYDHVVIAGDGDLYLKKNRQISIYPIPVLDASFEDLFQSHDFSRVIYFSDYLELHGSPFGELEKAKALFRACRKIHLSQNQNEPQIVYITSIDVTADVQTSKVVVLRACEELCEYYRTKYHLPVKVVRSPYLMQDDKMDSYLNRLFRQMDSEGRVVMEETKEQDCNYLSVEDLGEFLYRFLDHWDNEVQIVNLPPGFRYTFGDLGNAFLKLKSGITVEYSGKVACFQYHIETKTARKEYGWFAKNSLLDALPRLYAHYESHKEKPLGRLERLRKFYQAHTLWLKGLELLLGFGLVELIHYQLGTNVQFALVDIRLIFIVIMACTHGVNMGLAASVLEGVSIVLAYQSQGMDWRVLFYEPVNWIVFIWYMVIGAACGYIRDKRATELEFAQKDYALLDEKYHYIHQVYEDTSRHKQQYRKQIIGSRDSFGKIFEVTRKLDDVMPDHVFEEALAALEEVLENKTIAIYSVCQNQQFARLNVASHLLNHRISKTLLLQEIALAVPTIRKGEVWRNRDLNPSYPSYLAGICKGEELAAIVCVYQAEYDQMDLYYSNLIQVLAGLIQISLYRAIEYTEATRSAQYEEDTDIMRAEPFQRLCRRKASMQESGVASAVLLRINGPGPLTMMQLVGLEKRIRDTDVIGRGRNGKLYLLLNQVDDRSLELVLGRLNVPGLTFDPIELELSEVWEEKEC
ncbi:MAG: NAD(P)-dependent oxidoreductase [Lachnospiraceae bacterium]|nr:NAD(P)-dependent oxidoreductase [Lachnospiraceae bacterium]MDD3794659.1 NAD(P)-dependent oxidoreductase [Lachnospiraceae bacterium]